MDWRTSCLKSIGPGQLAGSSKNQSTLCSGAASAPITPRQSFLTAIREFPGCAGRPDGVESGAERLGVVIYLSEL